MTNELPPNMPPSGLPEEADLLYPPREPSALDDTVRIEAEDVAPGLSGQGVGLPPVAPPVRPAWTYFLMPTAIFLGLLIVAGALYVTRNDGSEKPTAAVAGSTQQGAATEGAAASSSPTAQKSLAAVLTSYARASGIDENKFVQCMASDSSNQKYSALIQKQLQRGVDIGINGTPTFVINNKMLVGAQPAAVFDEIVERELAGSPTAITAYSAQVQALAATNPPRFKILGGPVDVSDAAIEGSPQAKVVIAEFSDFQCPFCKKWTDDNLKRTRARLGNDVALAFLHFPITQIHPNAGTASLASLCAGEQGKFWQMHDLLFGRQEEWSNLKN